MNIYSVACAPGVHTCFLEEGGARVSSITFFSSTDAGRSSMRAYTFFIF